MGEEAFKHSFIFSPGNWQGEGRILLNMVEEELIFNTCWAVQQGDLLGKVACCQEIQIQGLSEDMRNDLTFYDFSGERFAVDMENPNVGRIVGTGVFNDEMIAWEFRGNEMHFEGFESYQKQGDGSYQMKGEYVTSDQFRTEITAKIWPQVLEESSEENQEPEDHLF